MQVHPTHLRSAQPNPDVFSSIRPPARCAGCPAKSPPEKFHDEIEATLRIVHKIVGNGRIEECSSEVATGIRFEIAMAFSCCELSRWVQPSLSARGGIAQMVGLSPGRPRPFRRADSSHNFVRPLRSAPHSSCLTVACRPPVELRERSRLREPSLFPRHFACRLSSETSTAWSFSRRAQPQEKGKSPAAVASNGVLERGETLGHTLLRRQEIPCRPARQGTPQRRERLTFAARIMVELVAGALAAPRRSCRRTDHQAHSSHRIRGKKTKTSLSMTRWRGTKQSCPRVSCRRTRLV